MFLLFCDIKQDCYSKLSINNMIDPNKSTLSSIMLSSSFITLGFLSLGKTHAINFSASW